MFLMLFRNILCPQQMFPSLRAQGNDMSNDVSATMCSRLLGPLQLCAHVDRNCRISREREALNRPVSTNSKCEALIYELISMSWFLRPL